MSKDVKEEVLNQESINETEQIKEEIKEKKKKKNTKRIIFNVIMTIFFLIIIVESIVGIINMQRLNDDKKPIWYINKEYEKTELKEETTYNLGLYKIVKTETSKKTKIALKPFFMN